MNQPLIHHQQLIPGSPRLELRDVRLRAKKHQRAITETPLFDVAPTRVGHASDTAQAVLFEVAVLPVTARRKPLRALVR